MSFFKLLYCILCFFFSSTHVLLYIFHNFLLHFFISQGYSTSCWHELCNTLLMLQANYATLLPVTKGRCMSWITMFYSLVPQEMGSQMIPRLSRLPSMPVLQQAVEGSFSQAARPIAVGRWCFAPIWNFIWKSGPY